MPGVGIGVYEGYAVGLHLGEQVSSTYEGRHITVEERRLIHPFHADDLVDKGDPVIVAATAATSPHATYGRAVGVALTSATTINDFIVIDTEGIWLLAAYADDDSGGATGAIAPGDALWISDDSTTTDATIAANGTGDAAISKIRNNITQVPFGYALGTMAAGGVGTISIKVHWDPRSHWLLDQERLWFGNGAGASTDGDVSIQWTGARLEMLPLGDNIDFNIGDGTNSMDVEIFGNTNAYSLLWDSALNTLTQTSLIAAADAAHHLIVTDTSAGAIQTQGFHLNLTKTAGAITGELVGIASDIGLQSEAAHCYAFSAYTEVTGGSSDADFSAFRCYMNNLGAAAANVNRYTCAQLEMNSTVTASKDPALTGNSFIYFYSHGGAATQYFYIPDMLGATWMFRWASPNVAPVAADASADAWTHRIACQVGGLTRYIKLSSA